MLSFFRRFINREESENNSAILQLTSMPESQEMIRKYTKLVVAELAPDELIIFEQELESFFNDPLPPNKDEFQKDNPLGSGDIFGEIITYTPPVALAVVSVIVYILNIIPKKDKKAIRKACVKKILDPHSLTKEKAKKYERSIKEALELFQIPDDEKQKMTGVIMAKLFMEE